MQIEVEEEEEEEDLLLGLSWRQYFFPLDTYINTTRVERNEVRYR